MVKSSRNVLLADEISKQSGISSNAVLRTIYTLEELGYTIEKSKTPAKLVTTTSTKGDDEKGDTSATTTGAPG